jgi:hypothetical protein
MLKKVPGNPLLHKLRVIHILEADYNLTLKAIFGRRLLKNCEAYGTLGEIQDGFRKGRSTTRTLLINEIVNDYNKRLRLDNQNTTPTQRVTSMEMARAQVTRRVSGANRVRFFFNFTMSTCQALKCQQTPET